MYVSAGFNGHLHTPVEILHVYLLGIVKCMIRDAMDEMKSTSARSIIGRWAAFNTSGLDVPPVIPKTMYKHYKSLVGKELRLVVQAAPFVIFEDLPEKKRPMWISLCHLGSYIFETEIDNMPTYLAGLRAWINCFLNETIKVNARWINKPKFHHLQHLPESIELYGPASLFATQTFEGFNKYTRNASVHSNRQSPGHDIADTFTTGRLLRMVTSGGQFWDTKFATYVSAGRKLLKIFKNNTMIQQSLGYNSSWNSRIEPKVHSKIVSYLNFFLCKFFSRPQNRHKPFPIFPEHTVQMLKTLNVETPPRLVATFPQVEWESVHGIRLKRGHELEAGTFISVCTSLSKRNVSKTPNICLAFSRVFPTTNMTKA